MGARQDFVDSSKPLFSRAAVTSPTPAANDLMVVEDVPIKTENIQAPIYGTPHPTRKDLILVYYGVLKSNNEYTDVRKIWVNVRITQDMYNYAMKWAGDSDEHPTFKREYIERRDTYAKWQRGTPLQSVYRIQVTNAGTGYTAVPTVTVAGNATARAILDGLGGIGLIEVLTEGSGFTTAPSVTIAPPPSGTTATATAFIQPQARKEVATIVLTNSGSGYTTPPAVTLSGGGGTGATAQAFVDNDGTISFIAVTFGGTGYTSAPSVAVAAGSGTTATATSTIQTASCVLLSEETHTLEQSHPNLHSLFIGVTRTFETLSGAVIIGTEPVTSNRFLMRHVSSSTKYTTFQRVPYGFTPPKNFLVLESAVAGESRVGQTLKVTSVKNYDILNARWRDKREFSLEVMQFDEIVPTGTEPLPNALGRVESKVDAVDSLHDIRTTVTVIPQGVYGANVGSAINIAGMVSQDPNLGTATIIQTSGAHSLSTGMTVLIAGVSGGSFLPPINDYFVVEVIDSTHFKIASRMIAAGTGGTVQQKKVVYPWIYEGKGYGIEVDENTKSLMINRRRKNLGSAILETAQIFTGASGAITASYSAGQVTALTISNGGSGYADFVNLTFAAGTSSRIASGYATAVNGVITGVVLTDGGAGYSGAPAVTVMQKVLMDTKRVDIDDLVAWEECSVSTQPAALDESSALISYKSMAYSFPAWIQPELVSWFSSDYVSKYDYIPNYQGAEAKIVKAKVLTWFDFHENPPDEPDIDEIITDTVTLLGRNFHGVLHDALPNILTENIIADSIAGKYNILRSADLGATTPSFSEYTGMTRLAGYARINYGTGNITGVGTSFGVFSAGDKFQIGSGVFQRGSSASLLTVAGVTDSLTMSATASIGTVGTGATFHVAIIPGGGGAIDVTVTANGSGYADGTWDLTVTGTGSGAAVKAIVSGGIVVGVLHVNRGHSYTGTPTASLSVTVSPLLPIFRYDNSTAWIGQLKTIEAEAVPYKGGKMYRYQKIQLVMR